MSLLKGEGVRWGVTKCDRGRGSFAMRDVTPVKYYNFISTHIRLISLDTIVRLKKQNNFVLQFNYLNGKPA